MSQAKVEIKESKAKVNVKKSNKKSKSQLVVFVFRCSPLYLVLKGIVLF